MSVSHKGLFQIDVAVAAPIANNTTSDETSNLPPLKAKLAVKC